MAGGGTGADHHRASLQHRAISFEAGDPLTVAFGAKDAKETDSGIGCIGEPNQQMSEVGPIPQITDDATGEAEAVTDGY